MTTMEWISLIAALLSGVGGGMLAIGIMRGQILSMQREQEQWRREINVRLNEQTRRIDSIIRDGHEH